MNRISLRVKLALIMAILICTVVSIVILLNKFVFEKYYINNQKKNLISCYDEMSRIIEYDGFGSDSSRERMVKLNELHNINIFVVDSSWKRAYGTQNREEDVYLWLQRFMFSHDKDIKIIVEKDAYTIKQGKDITNGMSYMILYGTVEDGTQIFMQVVLDSIRNNIDIFNKFVLVTGASVLLLGMIAIYFIAGRFTKPVQQISKVAEEMSKLNFDVKYTGDYQNEIGRLGESMNRMSDNLKENIQMLKNANYELSRDIEEKTQIAERQREFLGNVSHELKTPIALIQGYAEGLKEGVTDDKESLDFYCDVIMDEAIKMNGLVKKLLSLDHIESGKDNINIERFNLTELMSEIVKSNAIRTNQKNIKYYFQCPDDINVWYDKLQIEEVFTNFYTNAINHSDGIIRVYGEKNDKIIKVSVYNTGKTIAGEDITRIWEKFYKADKARTREYGGNGIGLSIVKAILDNYNADFGVDNCENGVVFWFCLECE